MRLAHATRTDPDCWPRDASVESAIPPFTLVLTGEILAITRARMAIRSRDAAAAEHELEGYPDGVPTTVGAIAELQQVRAHLGLIARRSESREVVGRGVVDGHRPRRHRDAPRV